jgi:chromosome segregation ATPase
VSDELKAALAEIEALKADNAAAQEQAARAERDAHELEQENARLNADNAALERGLCRHLMSREELSAEGFDDLSSLMQSTRELLNQPLPGAALLERLNALTGLADAFAAECENAVRHHEGKAEGGVQVPYHGDFAQVRPSVVMRLRWWGKAFREALAGETGSVDALRSERDAAVSHANDLERGLTGARKAVQEHEDRKMEWMNRATSAESELAASCVRIAALEQEVDDWKEASNLVGSDGDTARVTPAHLSADLQARDAELATAREQVERLGLLAQEARDAAFEEAAGVAESAEATPPGMRVGLHIVAGRIRALKSGVGTSDGTCRVDA